MPKGTQLVVSLTNKPGTLAELSSALSKASVNITGIFAPEAKAKGQVRLMVDDLDSARSVLKKAKIRFSEEDVIVIELENRPGAFGEIAEKLAKSKINIRYAYATTTPYTYARVVAAVPDVAKALRALGES